MSDREARDELFALNDRLSTFVDGEAVWVTASIIRHACRLLEEAEAERDRCRDAKAMEVTLKNNAIAEQRKMQQLAIKERRDRDRAIRVVEAARDVPPGLRGPRLREALAAFDADLEGHA